MNTGAEFSKDRLYRYSLWRVWDTENPLVMFIGLNPSTADETKNDPTVRRCLQYAADWGFGGMYMMNVFALRSTDPQALYRAEDPVGELNDFYLKRAYEKTERAVAAWGNHGSLMNRGNQVIELLGVLQCFGVTKEGQPKHPLYLRRDLVPGPLGKI